MCSALLYNVDPADLLDLASPALSFSRKMTTRLSVSSYTVLSVSGTAGTLHVWRPSSGAPLRSQTGCTISSSSCLALSPTRVLALTQNISQTSASLSTFLPSRAAGGPISRVSLPSPTCCAVAASNSGSFLALGDTNGVLHVYHLATGALFRSVSAHFRGVSRIVFSDDDEVLLTAGADGEVLAFTVADLVDLTRPRDEPPKPRISLHAHALPCTALAIGYAGASARVLTAGKDRAARLWHLSSGRCIAIVLFNAPPTEAVLSPDESAGYVGLSSGEVVVLDVGALPDTPVSASGLPKMRPPVAPGEQIPAVTALTLSPMGEEVIAGYSDGVVRVYDAWSRQLIASYARHGTTAAIDCVRILPGEEAAVETGPHAAKTEAEVSFDKVFDPDLATRFEPIVSLPGRKTVKAAAAEVIADAVKLAFAGMETGTEPNDDLEIDRTLQQNGMYASTGDVDEADVGKTVPPEVLRELQFLRKRNKELEDAGKRLIQLVEHDSI